MRRSARTMLLSASVAVTVVLGSAPAFASARPEPAGHRSSVAAAGGGTIQGTLTAADGTPLLTGVTTQTLDGSQVFNGGTDAAGHYRFTGLPPGTYVVDFAVTGWLTQYAPGRMDFSSAGQYAVTSGAVTTVDDKALPTGAVTGHFRDGAGHGVKASVSLIEPSGEPLFGAQTDADGAYTMAVFAGTWLVEFDYGNTIREYAYQQTDQSRANRFTVGAGQTVVVDDTTLPAGTLAGRLLDNDGTPATGANVSLSGVSNGVWVQATTTADGTYRIDGVPAGDYTAEFTTADGKRHQWAHHTTDQSRAATITVGADATTTLDDQFVPTGTLALTATDNKGTPLADFCGYIWGGGTEANVCSNGSGRVTITGVPAGDSYVVNVDVPGEKYMQTTLEPVAVVGGQTTTETTILQPASTIDATVLDAKTHKPVADVCVTPVLAPGSGLGESGGPCTRADGKVHIAYLPVGTYALYAWPEDKTHGQQWVGAGHGTGSETAAAKITTVAYGAVTAPTIYLDGVGSVSGTVTDAATGKPVPGVCVGQYGVDAAWFHVGSCIGQTTDAAGRYAINGLGPYAWPIEFASAGTYAWQWSGGATSRGSAKPVTVTVGGVTRADAALIHGHRLLGTVKTATGAPVDSGVLVVDASTGDDVGPWADAPSGTFEVPLNPGQVRVEYLPSGSDKAFWYRNAPDFAHATVVRFGSTDQTLTLVVSAGGGRPVRGRQPLPVLCQHAPQSALPPCPTRH